MKTLVTRSLTSVVFAAIMLGGILWNRASFFLLFFLIGLFCLAEFIRMARQMDHRYFLVSPVHQVCLLSAGCGIIISFSGSLFRLGTFGSFSVFGPWIILFSLMILCIAEWQTGKPGKIYRVGMSLFGLIYISVPAGLMLDLRLEKSYHGFALIPLVIILLIWINDTMAYLVGSLIGRTPFFPAISPRKTWEGTAGGAILTITGAFLFAWFGKYYMVKDWISLGFIVAVAGNLGDLFESGLKRLAGIKDSGSIMPGHGGFLDRFDSLLFVIPLAWLYVRLFM